MAEYEKDKFVVLAVKDIERLPLETQEMLTVVSQDVRLLREMDDRDMEPKYYVCNQDEPYAPAILSAILLGERVRESNEKAKSTTLGMGTSDSE